MDQEKPFFEHLRELRSRVFASLIYVVVAFVLAYIFYHHYVWLLIEPLKQDLIMLKLYEGFVMRMQIAFYMALIATFPVHVYNVVAFILPALTQRERRIVLSTLISALVLAIVGGLFSYTQILPLSVTFLKSADFVPEGVVSQLTFSDNLLFIFQFIFAFVVLFQLPIVLIVLMAMGIVDRATLLNYSRYIIVLIFIISAIFTPPDIISQIGLAVPLILLFYVSILIAKIFKLGEPSN